MRFCDYKYHLEMMLAELQQLGREQQESLNAGHPTDTRVYLSLDIGEQAIIKRLLDEMLKVERQNYWHSFFSAIWQKTIKAT